jgi:hypothetical protein
VQEAVVSFDNSRFTFDPWKDYSGVVMQQGRVQLDSDWNEWLAELSRRLQAGTLDTMGRAAYPATTPYAFQITASGGGGTNVLTIGPGRMYVDGLLAENHGASKPTQWDPALGELSNVPQPPPGTETGAIDFTQQPYLAAGTVLPAGNGPFLAYLDVWIRPVTCLEDPNLIDEAVGIDTTGRLQTAWQVKLLDLSKSPGATCDSAIPGWPPVLSGGRLSTGTALSAPSGPCCLSAGTAYTGMENQFYRVEIHNIDATGTVTFKWSRDNAAVRTGVTNIASVTNSAGNPASQLSVQGLGRDQVLGFAPGDWIEILDDNLEFGGKSGELHKIDTIDFSAKTIALTNTLSGFTNGDTNPKVHTRVRRWDQSGKIYEQDGTTVWWDLDAHDSGDIPVPPPGTTLVLENGIIVTFSVSPSGASFLIGDFWTFAARTADGTVEILDSVPPRGIHHHYARLSIVTFPGSATDCRTKWPPNGSGEEECGCCCTCTVGDGVTSFGQYSSINDAINALPAIGGEVCILPGRYFEHVFIQDHRDVVLRGCGWQTRIASPSLKPAPAPAVRAGVAPANTTVTNAAAPTTLSGPTAAVITVSSSQHVQLLSFAVEATDGEIGVLIDGTGKLSAKPNSGTRGNNIAAAVVVQQSSGVVDTTLEDLVITASTLPAILACQTTLLRIERNRIAMENVRSTWPAVWASGIELRIVHNWLGMEEMAGRGSVGAFPDSEWLPSSVTADLRTDANASGASASSSSSKTMIHPGGIQIGGPSRDVFVLENEIDQAGRNGITLGSLSILDSNGNDTGQAGVTIVIEGPCDTTITLHIPGTNSGQPGSRVVASGKLVNIQINHNRIRNCGLCGIGPVGFFDLAQMLEVISIENLTISSNSISNTVQRAVAAAVQRASLFGYAAICVPDVENLVIRDNAVTEFGSQPGALVSGIFVLNGQVVEISRNHVLENRDWNLQTKAEEQSGGGLRGGIVVLLATPPTFTTTLSSSPNIAGVATHNVTPVYEPGLPALRVEHNVVRVPLGEALAVVGYGPFSIVNNNLGCGGTVKATGTPLAETVLILNLGIALEVASAAGTFNALNQGKYDFATANVNRGFAGSPGGAVLFANNICQLETRANGRHCLSSVMILSLDNVIFANNQCRLDGPTGTAFLDAWLIAGSLQVVGNRFQEASGAPVVASGLTKGALNITTQNISTYCLWAKGTLQPAVDVNNLVAISNAKTCDELARQLNL